MRGKAHKDDVKAQVIAALLVGAGVMEISRQLNIPESSVRNYKREIPEDKLAEINAKKGGRLDDMVYEYMTTSLKALNAQAEIASNAEYIQKQPAGELATLHGVMADKIVRLLEATTRARGAEPRQLGSGEEAAAA